MDQFVTEMCTYVHISATKWCIVGYLSYALWVWWDGSFCHWPMCIYPPVPCRCYGRALWTYNMQPFRSQTPWRPLLATVMERYMVGRLWALYQIYNLHNGPICNRNVHICAHFCYKMVHCGMFVWCIMGLVRWVYLSLTYVYIPPSSL